MPFLVRSMIASLYGLAETRVRVIVPAVGGGFGLKVHLYVEEAILPFLSRLVSGTGQVVGRPVRAPVRRRPLEGGACATSSWRRPTTDAFSRSGAGSSATAARTRGIRGRA